MNKKEFFWWLQILLPILISIPFLFNIIKLSSSKPASQCLGITIITAIYWIFEPVPNVVASLIPIVFLPLLFVTKASKIATVMFSDTSNVAIGGFIFSIAMTRWNLHSRIALKTVLIFGLRPKILLMGICLVTAFLSMWISNTATTLTMMPSVVAIITKLEEITGDVELVAPFAKALFLGIAYASGIGGISTLIGTPTNLILQQTAKSVFPNSSLLSFTDFFFVAMPLSIILLITMYIVFYFIYLRKINFPSNIDDSLFKENYKKLGPMSPGEKVVGILFILLALLWLFRVDIRIGNHFSIPGWSTLLDKQNGSEMILDGTVSLLLSMLLFFIKVPEKIIPKKDDSIHLSLLNTDDQSVTEITEIKFVPVLEWDLAQSKIPWSILLLFSGGFSLNQGFKDSTLDLWIGNKLKGLNNLSLPILILCISLVSSGLSNIAANLAVANLLIPIVASFAKNAQKYHPWLLMFPCCFAISTCFILPVATPPNLIVYGSGKISMKDFLITGTIINILSILIIIICSLILIPLVYDTSNFPEWGKFSNITQF